MRRAIDPRLPHSLIAGLSARANDVFAIRLYFEEIIDIADELDTDDEPYQID